MGRQGGITDSGKNPFATKGWIDQGYSFTDHRKRRLKEIIDASFEDIARFKPNEGRYPAFVAIRWGFAKVSQGKLRPTAKWTHREKYDQFGDPR